ncbi:MAG: trypsin-like peptidase domain-containing protein [Elusimicrobia bacterium]|nr:trypsin-like peptidase domain-containing protein [Elusimicrobiota bacterium]
MRHLLLSLFCLLLPFQALGQGLAVRPVTPRGPLSADERAVIDLFRGAVDSVVYITNLGVARDAFSYDLAEYPQGTGSGFVWDDEGHIVTNFHVIQGADAAEVTLADHSTWKAVFVGAAPDKDIAVLRIEAPKAKLKAIPLGTSRDLMVGQRVLAIGNPFGLDQTLTTGVISALGREIHSVTRRPITGVIQTDAAINPGNSGGPLLDSAGRLIGVNTAIYSPSGAYAGIGFAVPADVVASIVPQLIRHGKVVRPGIGIGIADDAMTRRAGLEGVLILGVEPGGSAAAAGLRPTRRDAYGRVTLGDLIVGVEGKPVRDSDDLFKALDGKTVGQSVEVTVLRDGRRRPVKVRLQAID